MIPNQYLSRVLPIADLVVENPIQSEDGNALWSGQFGLRGIGLMLSGGLSAQSEKASEDVPPLVTVRQSPLGHTVLTLAVVASYSLMYGRNQRTSILKAASCYLR